MRKRVNVVTLVMAVLATFSSSNRAMAELIYGVAMTDTNQQLLLGWDSSDPSAILSTLSLGSGPLALAIDATPYANAIWVLRSNGAFERINFVGGSLGGGSPLPALSGLRFGFEYNPVASPPPVDTIIELANFNVVSDLDQNLTGGLSSANVSHPALAYAIGDVNELKDPSVFGIAYTNNVQGATSATLYGIDSARDVLVTVDVLTGTLHTVGALGVDVISQGGFDISGKSGIAYATMMRANSSQSEFWTIDLSGGHATSLGAIAGGITVTAMTAAVPEPTSLTLLAAPLAILAASRRRQ